MPWRAAGFAVGLGLLVAATWMMWRQRETVGAAIASVRSARAADFALLLGGVAANVVLSAFVLRSLLARYGRVGVIEMPMVVASATMLNAIPMRPGLFGRVAYHRVVNGIAVADTAKTVAQAAVITAIVAAWIAVVAAVSIRLGASLWYGVAGPVPFLVAGAAFRAPRWLLVATLLRYAEVLVWAVRYHAAFALIGSPIAHDTALAFACVSMIASMIPFLSGGLGVREWAIGLLSPLLAGVPLEIGVTADLVNRAAAIVVVGAMGVPATVWVIGRMRGVVRRARRSQDPPT